MPKLIWFVLSGLVFGLDQITKYFASHQLTLNHELPLMPSLNLTLVYNHGAAFSFLSDAGGWQRWFFSLVSIIISIMLVITLIRLKRGSIAYLLACTLALGGAVGNLVDRIVDGYVTDFIDIYYKSWHWPVFNVADIAITLGALMLACLLLRPNS